MESNKQVEQAIESLRHRLCNDEEAWRDLCVVMGALSAQQPEAVAGDPTNPDGTERLCRLLYHRRPEPRDYIGSDCRMLHHAATLIERYQRITADRAEEFSEWWERHGQFSRAGGGEYEKTFAYNAWNAALNPGFGEPAP